MEPKYGLFKLSKNPPKKSELIQKSSVFGDSDSDDDTNVPPAYHHSSNLKRQTQSKIQKAVELDPTIFQYDEVYDEIKSQQPAEKIVGQIDKKPKYISNLLKMAETRKLEQEIRLERKIQKEREKEGNEFKDKESFVTSSYREKLEQMRKTHEEMEKQDAIEKMLDVTKHGDLNGFYRSLYKNNMFQDKNVDDNDDDDSTADKIVFNKSNVNRNKISIRERDTIKTDGCDEDDQNDDVTMAVPEKKSEENDELSTKKSMNEEKTKEDVVETTNKNNISSIPQSTVEEENKNSEQVNKEPEKQPPQSPPKPKLSRKELIEKLFTKRTIGDVYEQAKQRYFERRQQRLLKT